MSELVPFQLIKPEHVTSEARAILVQLARDYLVEIEAPCAPVTDWYVQIRLSTTPVLAGYYGATLREAASLVAASMQRHAAA